MAVTVLAATTWPTNGHLLADVFALHVTPRFGEVPRVLDPTYGRGRWWTVHRPARLVHHDLATDGVDFRRMRYLADTFDVTAYDPPYVAVGGRRTSTLGDYHARYGLVNAPTSPRALQTEVIEPGLTECCRVTRPGGLVLVKCQDYVTSGALFPGTHYTLAHALHLGMRLVDRLEHVAKAARPQPTDVPCRTCPGDTCPACHGTGRVPRRQVHARRNLSTLLILEVPHR